MLLLPLGAAAAQGRGAVNGRVLEAASQQPIQGAQVRVSGTNTVAVTDQQGRFQLQSVAAGARTLQVTAFGHKAGTAQVTVGATPAEVTIRLAQDALGLDEIVVVGYGEQRRRNVSGSVGSLRTETVQEVSQGSVNGVLQGRLAGVQVTQNSGAPGSAITVRIRGSSSISAGNQPLYVIDGVALVQGNFNRLNSTFGGSDIDALSDLNPNEIESIEVLKDASAAAIYGARASNGVVLITTKRGTAGRAEINFGGYYGSQERWRMPAFLGTEDYITIKNEGILNRFGIEDYFGYSDDAVENSVEVERGVNTNWIDEVMRTAPMSNFDASVRGGTERARYYVSGSAFDQTGIVQGFAYTRLSGRVNLDYVPTDRLTLGTNVSLSRGVVDRQRGDNTIYGPLANAVANPPVQPVYNPDGTYYETSYVNPVGLYKENSFEERSLRILGNSFATLRLAEGLNLRGSVGLDQYNLRSRAYESPVIGLYAGSGGAGTAGTAYATKATYEGTLNFSRLFADRHDFSGVIGASYEDNTENYSSVSGQAFPSNAFRYLTSAATINAGTDSVSNWGL
ncbi:MAG TPA: SusC/RagA family TonB-linked outer membrane protein, partial [Longimicrobiaceae bacterium]